jgi:holliday junction DNA helicase RuvA
MIGRIAGKLLEKNPPQLLVDANGVGYEVSVPMSTFFNLPRIGETVALLTHMVVREDAQLLYGFASESERAAFRTLIKVSGVGPKVALAVLSGLSVNDLASAVTLQETGRLTNIPGIGKKTAERLLLELKDKFKVDPRLAMGVGTTAATPSANEDVLNALIGLGYSDKEAILAVKQLPTDVGVSDGIRLALKSLSKG